MCQLKLLQYLPVHIVKIKWFDNDIENIIETDEHIIVQKPTTITSVTLYSDNIYVGPNPTWTIYGAGVLTPIITRISEITPEYIGTYSKEEIDTKLSENLPTPDAIGAAALHTADDNSTYIILTSPQGKLFSLSVDDNGVLTTTQINTGEE